MKTTTCTCTRDRCCDAYHEVRVDGLLHPDTKAFAAEREGAPLRAWRRHDPGGEPLSERVEADGVALECGLRGYETDEAALSAMRA